MNIVNKLLRIIRCTFGKPATRCEVCGKVRQTECAACGKQLCYGHAFAEESFWFCSYHYWEDPGIYKCGSKTEPAKVESNEVQNGPHA